jgi:UDP-4-amino-4,6-dideoxy-N-acetyl-beta-L-altrosamine transaminase
VKLEGDVQPFLPYGRQVIEDDDLDAVRQALLSPYLTTGPLVEEFEHALSAATGARETVACSNGTAALHLAARAIKLERSQVSIVPSITFVATANATRYCGAEVVFADVDPDTGLMTPETLLAALRKAGGAARAVFPVHLNGQSCDMAGIAEVARSWGLWVVEDACHAIGGTQPIATGMSPVGSCAYSDMACFSFHPVKTVAMGEGGAIATNDSALAKAMRIDRSHGLVRDADSLTLPEAIGADGAPEPWFYELAEPGFNYRVPDILCALGISQLKKLSRFTAQRARLVSLYREALADLAPVIRPLRDLGRGEAAWHLFVVKIDFESAGTTRGQLMRRLSEAGIGSQVHYIPVHRQPYYAKRYPGTELPGADAYYASCLSLPLSAAMTEDDVLRVARALTAAISRG